MSSASYGQALSSYQRGEIAEAASICHAILETGAANSPAAHLLGVILLESGQAESALDLADRALTQEPENQAFLNFHGNVLMRQQRWSQAAESFQRLIAADPHAPAAWAGLCTCLTELGRTSEAIAYCDDAIERQCASGALYFVLGKALAADGDLDRAMQAYAKAVELDAAYAEAHFNLGNVAGALQRWDSAIEAYEKAVAVRPSYAEAQFNLGVALQRTPGREQAAIEAFKAAIAARPAFPEAVYNLGVQLHRTGDYEQAAACYRSVLQDAANADCGAIPTDSCVFLLNAIEGEACDYDVQMRYVRSLFDGYAERFDRHLENQLGYDVPRCLHEAVRAHDRALSGLTVLDLGCGTGLCAEQFRELSARLVGIDVSGNMIAAAEAKGLYDALHTGDFHDLLSADRRRYDLVLAADVFIYVGHMELAIDLVRRSLRPGGLFAFSVERSNGPDVALRPSGRYAHREAYLRLLLGGAGFVVQQLTNTIIRHERGESIEGYLVLASAEGRFTGG